MSEKITLDQLSAVYHQDSDSCDTDDSEQELTIETHDGGAGKYYVIKTQRWAFEKTEELINVLNDFIAKVGENGCMECAPKLGLTLSTFSLMTGKQKNRDFLFLRGE